MEVRFSPEQESKLSQIADHYGIDTTQLVRDAALSLIEEYEGLRAAVREGTSAADRSELVNDEEVRDWLEARERA